MQIDNENGLFYKKSADEPLTEYDGGDGGEGLLTFTIATKTKESEDADYSGK